MTKNITTVAQSFRVGKTVWFTCSIFFFLVCSCQDISAKTILKVGVYNNTPTIFMGSDGKAGGLFIDILENIAHREDWQLQYVFGDFSDVFASLKAAEIDLLPAVAFSQEREAVIDYNFTTVMANWAVLYAPENGGITSLKELEGKKLQSNREISIFRP